jgi:large subunit ribosomal protein L15
MYLNDLRPAEGAKKSKVRLGRGIGSTKGKTAGRGHKGQHARSGGFHKVGFEGGQMPLQRRLPKVGFRSQTKKLSTEVGVRELSRVEGGSVTLETLVKAGLVKSTAVHVKIVKNADATSALKVTGLKVTKGARETIEKAGGLVE